MSSDLQALVDALGTAISRPIGVDDARFRLAAYNPHEGEVVDSVRLAKLLHREADGSVQAWLERHGASTARSHARIPRNHELDMAARILVPLRFDGILVGYLVLLDEPDPLTEAELAEALRYADDMSLAMFREHRLNHAQRRREIAALRALLGISAPYAEAPDEDLPADELLVAASGYACLVARPDHAAGGRLPEWTRVSVAAVIERMRGTVARDHFISTTAGNEAIGVLAVASPRELDTFLSTLLDRLQDRFGHESTVRPIVGVGDTVASVAELPASLEQARRSADVACRVERFAPLARWSSLGSYGTVARLLDGQERRRSPASLRRLEQDPAADVLLPTLEAYLDHGGDPAATAAALHVHRSSLYPRLRRIEQIAQVELSSGDARLELHLGLRLQRLAPPVAGG